MVEGNNDFHVIVNLCEKCGLDNIFDPENKETINKLLEGFSVLLKGSGNLKNLGILVDADRDLNGRWNQIRRIIAASGKYEDIPIDMPREGLILSPVDSDDIKIGVWILPDNNFDGMLEDFILQLIPSDDQLLPLADSVLVALEKRELNRYNPIHRSKAKMHTWLAWQEVPGSPMGKAIGFNYIPTSSSLCHNFVDWLDRLFNR